MPDLSSRSRQMSMCTGRAQKSWQDANKTAPATKNEMALFIFFKVLLNFIK